MRRGRHQVTHRDTVSPASSETSFKIADCFSLNDAGKAVFSVAEFIRLNDLPDHPELRMIIIEDMQEIFPEAEILEDCGVSAKIQPEPCHLVKDNVATKQGNVELDGDIWPLLRAISMAFQTAFDDDEMQRRHTSVEKFDRCIRINGAGRPVFSIGEFLRLNNLPDDPRLRLIIMEEVREIFPAVQILEEMN